MKYFAFLLIILGINLSANAQIEGNKLQRNNLSVSSSSEKLQIFLKIEGLNGDSQDAKHMKWIDCSSIFFETKNSTSSGQLSGKPVFNLILQKWVDTSSAFILEYTSTHKLFPKIQIEMTQKINNIWVSKLKYELKNGWIESYKISGSENELNMTEEIKLVFESNTTTYYTYDEKGVLINTKNIVLGNTNS